MKRIREYLGRFRKYLSKFWEKLPKELKVLCYMVGAGILDSIIMWLQPELIYWIPIKYRVLAWNAVEVIVIESLKRAKLYLEARGGKKSK